MGGGPSRSRCHHTRCAMSQVGNPACKQIPWTKDAKLSGSSDSCPMLPMRDLQGLPSTGCVCEGRLEASSVGERQDRLPLH